MGIDLFSNLGSRGARRADHRRTSGRTAMGNRMRDEGRDPDFSTVNPIEEAAGVIVDSSQRENDIIGYEELPLQLLVATVATTRNNV
jgi:hypothetical protein